MACFTGPECDFVGYAAENKVDAFACVAAQCCRDDVEFVGQSKIFQREFDGLNIVHVGFEIHFTGKCERIDRVVDGRDFQGDVAVGMVSGCDYEVETALRFG